MTQELVDQLEEQVRSGKYPSGEKLPTEAQIIAEFGVSRTVVREAIKHLQAAGVVETQHGIGTFVLPASSSRRGFRIDPETITTLREILAVLEFRLSFETEAAALAAQRRTNDQLNAMALTLEQFRLQPVRPNNDSATLDFQFHLQIAEATGNTHFPAIMNHLGAVIIPRTRLNTAQLAGARPADYLAMLVAEHTAIFEPIRRQDPEGARAAMRLHIGNSAARLLEASKIGQLNPAV